jgi:hypothetical protein
MKKLLFAGLAGALALVTVACGGDEEAALESPGQSAQPSPAYTAAADPSPTVGAADASIRFAVKGDFGDGSEAQGVITSRMCEWREDRGFTLVVTVGDSFYNPDGTATDDNYYDPERCLYSHPGHAWRAAWGNHDAAGASTAEVLGGPASPRYYSWTAGAVAFFAYDGNDVTDDQASWLREAVCSSTAPVKIIYGHQPPYSTGPHGSDLEVRDMVHPVAKDCDARLVLSGHDHIYERSVAVDGVTYVVTGGGGARLYQCGDSQAWVAVCIARHHFLYVEVDDGKISVRAVGTAGEIIDSLDIGR